LGEALSGEKLNPDDERGRGLRELVREGKGGVKRRPGELFGHGIDPPVGSLFHRRYLERLWRYARIYRSLLLWTVLAGMAGFVLAFVYPWLIGNAIDTVIAPRGKAQQWSNYERFRYLMMLTSVGLVTAGLHAGVAYLRGHTTVKLGHRIAHHLRRDLFDHFQRLSLHFYSKQRTGSIVSRLIHDVHQATGIIYGGIIVVGLDVGQLIIAMVLLTLISWKLTLAVIFVLPMYALTFRIFNPRVRVASEQVASHIGQISGTVQERLAGIAVVKTYGAEDRELHRWERDNEEHFDRVVQQSAIAHTVGAVSEVLVHTGTTIVIGFGGWLAMKGELSAGDITKFLGYLGIMYGPVRRFADLNIVYQTSRAAMERVFRVFDIKPKVAEHANAVTKSPAQGDVTFDHVYFRYDDLSDESRVKLDEDPTPTGATETEGVSTKWILEDINVVVPAGKRVALVGPSGAGKTTLVSLLPRLYDVGEGRILIDGVDLRDYTLKALRHAIAVVQQESFVFSGTVRENISYGRPDASKDEIEAAARAANAHEFIQRLPKGYDTRLGERGVNMSGGQRQRLSIARALLKDPRILILDEATSALDSESEALVQQALGRLMEGRTCFIIAHRLSTVRDADVILVMDGGKIVETGTHDELIERGGLYAKLATRQFGLNKEEESPEAVAGQEARLVRAG
jgi:subfamily B ATP-binding cassette protein MsbA